MSAHCAPGTSGGVAQENVYRNRLRLVMIVCRWIFDIATANGTRSVISSQPAEMTWDVLSPRDR